MKTKIFVKLNEATEDWQELFYISEDHVKELQEKLNRAYENRKRDAMQNENNKGSDAVEFGEWLKESKYSVNSQNDWFSYDSYDKPSTEDLYELFKAAPKQ